MKVLSRARRSRESMGRGVGDDSDSAGGGASRTTTPAVVSATTQTSSRHDLIAKDNNSCNASSVSSNRVRPLTKNKATTVAATKAAATAGMPLPPWRFGRSRSQRSTTAVQDDVCDKADTDDHDDAAVRTRDTQTIHRGVAPPGATTKSKTPIYGCSYEEQACYEEVADTTSASGSAMYSGIGSCVTGSSPGSSNLSSNDTPGMASVPTSPESMKPPPAPQRGGTDDAPTDGRPTTTDPYWIADGQHNATPGVADDVEMPPPPAVLGCAPNMTFDTAIPRDYSLISSTDGADQHHRRQQSGGGAGLVSANNSLYDTDLDCIDYDNQSTIEFYNNDSNINSYDYSLQPDHDPYQQSNNEDVAATRVLGVHHGAIVFDTDEDAAELDLRLDNVAVPGTATSPPSRITPLYRGTYPAFVSPNSPTSISPIIPTASPREGSDTASPTSSYESATSSSSTEEDGDNNKKLRKLPHPVCLQLQLPGDNRYYGNEQDGERGERRHDRSKKAMGTSSTITPPILMVETRSDIVSVNETLEDPSAIGVDDGGGATALGNILLENWRHNQFHAAEGGGGFGDGRHPTRKSRANGKKGTTSPAEDTDNGDSWGQGCLRKRWMLIFLTFVILIVATSVLVAALAFTKLKSQNSGDSTGASLAASSETNNDCFGCVPTPSPTSSFNSDGGSLRPTTAPTQLGEQQNPTQPPVPRFIPSVPTNAPTAITSVNDPTVEENPTPAPTFSTFDATTIAPSATPTAMVISATRTPTRDQPPSARPTAMEPAPTAQPTLSPVRQASTSPSTTYLRTTSPTASPISQTQPQPIGEALRAMILNVSPESADPLAYENSREAIALRWLEFHPNNAGLPEDRLTARWALAVFAGNTGWREWSNNDGWLGDEQECDWFGIQCDEDGKVMSISLSSNGLASNGRFPSTLSVLSDSLIELNLARNSLSGYLPSELGRLGQLQTLNLAVNRFTGGLSTLSRLPRVESIDISRNSFFGLAVGVCSIPTLEQFVADCGEVRAYCVTCGNV